MCPGTRATSKERKATDGFGMAAPRPRLRAPAPAEISGPMHPAAHFPPLFHTQTLAHAFRTKLRPEDEHAMKAANAGWVFTRTSPVQDNCAASGPMPVHRGLKEKGTSRVKRTGRRLSGPEHLKYRPGGGGEGYIVLCTLLFSNSSALDPTGKFLFCEDGGKNLSEPTHATAAHGSGRGRPRPSRECALPSGASGTVRRQATSARRLRIGQREACPGSCARRQSR